MKKLIALALAILMIAAMAIPAFAADENGDGADEDATVQVTDNVVDELWDGKAEPDGEQDMTDVEVQYGVDQTYLVTIPCELMFDPTTLTTSATLNVSNVQIAGDEQVYVEIASGHQTVDDAKAWQMVDQNESAAGGEASARVTYTAKIDGYTAALVDEDVVLTVAAPEGNKGINNQQSGSVLISFATAGTTQEGNYLDTLTFTVGIENKDADGAFAKIVVAD